MSNMQYLVSKKYTQLSGKDSKLISFKKFNALFQFCFRKHFWLGFPNNKKNLKSYYHMNIVITPRNTKTNFNKHCNSIEMSFDDRHASINLKYCDINELNALNDKGSYFEIVHLNIASLSKHIVCN